MEVTEEQRQLAQQARAYGEQMQALTGTDGGKQKVHVHVQLTRNLNASKKNLVSSARHASSRARVVFECEGSRARSRSQARGIWKLAARCYYSTY